MQSRHWLRLADLISIGFVIGLAQLCTAQDSSTGGSNWSSSTQQQDPRGAVNPTRTRGTHSEAAGKVIDSKSVEVLGPDGRYVPYLDIETESVKVDGTTVRTIQRSFATGQDGQKTLVQVRQEETRSLPGGEQKVLRTVSNPNANGNLTEVQRETQDSRLTSPGVRETRNTVLTPNADGRFTPSVQTEERQSEGKDGTVESRKTTQISDGSGRWQTVEVREGTSKKENGQEVSKEERVMRPDADGKLAAVERTVSKQTEPSSGEKRQTTETFSANIPGVVGDGSLQLVQRETRTSRSTATGDQTSTRQVERPTPGSPGDGLRVTEQAIDIVRPGVGGVAEQKRTILARDSDGRLNEVWVDVGKTDNPVAVQVDTGKPAKPQ